MKLTKQDPLQSSGSGPSSPSSPSFSTNHMQTVPMAEELEAPPPYAPSDSAPAPARPLSAHSHASSNSSLPGEDTPLQNQSGYEPNPAPVAPDTPAAPVTFQEGQYQRQQAMKADLDAKRELWRQQPGACCSESGGCCCSEMGGCLFSSNGGCMGSSDSGCCFSSKGGCCFSDHGGCCFSDNGGCCFRDNGGCCFSEGVKN